MRSLLKALRIAKIEGKNWKQELQIFLRAYRTTPHSTTKIAPSELMFNRKVKTKLPEYQQQQVDTNSTLRDRDAQAKQKMKEYADNRHNAKMNDLKVGDSVLVRQQKREKLSSYFDPIPYTITNIQGTMVTAKRKDHAITRNSSFFRRINPPTTTSTAIEENSSQSQSDDDDLPEAEITQPTPIQQPQPLRQTTPAIQQQTTPRPQRQRRLPRRLNDFVINSIY